MSTGLRCSGRLGPLHLPSCTTPPSSFSALLPGPLRDIQNIQRELYLMYSLDTR